MELGAVVLMFVLFIAINIAIIRWVLRINDIINLLKDIKSLLKVKP
jgi:hypothetical protein